MRKKLIQKITILAILTALAMVLKKFSFGTGEYRISLYDTPVILAGIIAGPLWGMVVAFLSDFLYSLLSGYAYSFIMMFSALLWGVVGGLFYKKKVNYFLLFILIFFASILNTTINSVQLYIWYGAGSLIAGLPLRITTMIIKWPITTTVVYILYNRVVVPVLGSIFKEKKISEEKVSDNKTVDYDLLNQDDLDPKLSVKSVELSKSDVIVRGSQETIDSIATIKALIDLDNEDFTKAGTYTVDNLKLVAYGNDGTIIDAEIVATNINAKVVLDSYSKRVPVKIETTGELVSGKAISSITINGVNANDFETTIYGDEAALENVSYITAYIDVADQGNNGSKSSKVTLPKPAGVRSISDESVSIVLNFGEAKQKTVTINGIRVTNVPNGLVANLVNVNDFSIDVQVIGVESVINGIDESSPGIYAYVDLTGYGVGTFFHHPRLRFEYHETGAGSI